MRRVKQGATWAESATVFGSHARAGRAEDADRKFPRPSEGKGRQEESRAAWEEVEVDTTGEIEGSRSWAVDEGWALSAAVAHELTQVGEEQVCLFSGPGPGLRQGVCAQNDQAGSQAVAPLAGGNRGAEFIAVTVGCRGREGLSSKESRSHLDACGAGEVCDG